MSEDEIIGFGLAQVRVEGAIHFGDGTVLAPGDPGYDEAKAKIDDEFAFNDHVSLPSGRKFYANCLIVGIDDEGGVFEGYDGGVSDDKFTPAERIDLADMMIARWTDYKRAAERGK